MSLEKSPADANYSIEWPTTLLLIITPIIAVGGGIWYEVAVGFKWYHVLAFLAFSALTGVSITAGYHRLWAHNTYKAHPTVRLFLALFGAATYQNSILTWASQHRRHHLHVDDNDNDPYSANKGLWFSHVGWLLRKYPNNQDNFTNCRDLQQDPIVMWQHKYYYSIALLMNILPPALLGMITGEYLAFFLTAGFMRMVYTHHTTFFINSLAHYWGSRPYTTKNTARDNGLLAFFTYGEGYHNYHHMFQGDFRNGVRWYQFDPTKWLIQSLAWLRLASNLRSTPSFKIREAMVSRQLEKAKLALAQGDRYQAWQDYIDREKIQFAELLKDWRETRVQWFAIQKQRLDDARQELRNNMESSVLSSRLKELEFAMQMQYSRLRRFNDSFA